MKKFGRIFRYLGFYKTKIALYFLLVILATVFSVFSLALLAPFMDIIFKTNSSGAAAETLKAKGGQFLSDTLTNAIQQHGAMYALGLVCAFIIVSVVLKNLCLYLSSYISVPMRNSIMIQLKKDLFNKVLMLPIGFFSEQKKGDILSRMTTDMSEVESSVMNTLEGLIKDPIQVLGYLFSMIYLSPTLSLFLLVLLPVTGFLIGRISRKLKKHSSESAVRSGEALSVLDETLGGMRVVKAFSAEQLQKNKFNSINDIIFRLGKKMSARRDLASPLTEVLGVAVLCVILYFGGNLVLNAKTLTGGNLIAYISLFAMMINPAKNLSSSVFNVQKGAAAVERIESILQEPVVVEDNGTKALELFSHQIEFKNVSFGYGENLILKNINLTISKGKSIALVGSSGAGKSTLADLIPRFHDVATGEILIDGINIKDYTLASVRNQISIVTQEPILFNDSIANNIALAKPNATREEITQAAQVANAYNFIQAKEEKFNTNIGDRGNKLSGGEKQRLTIARALLKNAPVLILDEATSSLDTESERLVQDAINNMMQNRTSVVIAHRLSTIYNADEIIVLNKGEIAERGKHEDLMKIENGIYKKLVAMQEVK
ncbi:MAG: ABC transporter ATP-binding protein/permease [Chitinophagaceae bacterium]|jgi:subfamily B ATP-binding cassette protein MsbA|nr:ABC transporter ATP-binding protein/permease [Chitinophagaceae bacterium]